MGTSVKLESYPEIKLAVEVNKVNKYYGQMPILRDICMHVQEGIVYGLLGSSGCGKTSLLGCIVGLKQYTGQVSVFGNTMENGNGNIMETGTGMSPQDIGYMPQDVALYDQLTVNEMLKYYAKLYHMTTEKFKSQLTLLEDLLDLTKYGSRRISNLSGGQKRRVSLALTLLHSPKLLILDEPTVGLDPLLRNNIWVYLYKLANTYNTTIIITTHYIEEVRNSKMVGVMRKGTLLVEDDPISLMKQHNASLLEEVVLKICRLDRHNRRKSYEIEAQTLESVQVSKNNNKLCKCFHREKTPKIKNSLAKPVKAKDKSVNRNKTGESSRALAVTRSIQRTLAYAEIVWSNFIHNPVFILLVLMLPAFQLFSTGIVIGVEPKYTPIGIINHEILNWKDVCYESESYKQGHENGTCDLSKLSCTLIHHFTKGIYIEPVEFYTAQDAKSAAARGSIRGYIEIPDNYSVHVIERAVTTLFANNETIDGTTVTMHMDMSEIVTIYVVMAELFRSFDRFVNELTTVCDFSLKIIELPFFYREPVYGEMDVTARDYALPALIAGIIFEISFAVAPLVFITDAKKGTVERSSVAGLKYSELLAGLFINMAALSVIQALICYVSLGWGLGFDIQGSIFPYIGVCLATTFCSGALGLLVGVMYKDEFMVAITGIFLIPLLMIYSGILRPVEIIPEPYRSLIFYFFPTAAIINPFRFIMNRGVSIAHGMVWPGTLVTLGWGLVFYLISLYVLKKMNR